MFTVFEILYWQMFVKCQLKSVRPRRHVPVACLPSRSTQRCSKAWLCSWRELGFSVLTNWISSSLNSSSLASSGMMDNKTRDTNVKSRTILCVFLLDHGYSYITFSAIPPVLLTNTSLPIPHKTHYILLFTKLKTENVCIILQLTSPAEAKKICNDS